LVATDSRPVLWQLQISHYNEKVRWALDYKRIPHVRRSLLPGMHRLKTWQLTRTLTTPVLTMNGMSIPDSTQIIAALEERWPEPPLYPSDPVERRRAFDLEEFFDEELGPDIRRALYHELLERPEIVLPLFDNGQNAVARAMLHASFPVLRAAMRQAMDIYDEPAERSREKMYDALDRLEAELGGRDYLVGDRFTVADLTAASLFYPLAMPPEYPYPLATEIPPRAQEFLDDVAGRPGSLWVAEMFRRHRPIARR
jgi:glutathione S-transferase